MTDIKKYVEGKSQAELIETQRNSVVGGDIYKAVSFEIQRIQQDTNNIQIAKLIDAVNQLKEITNQSADTATQSARSSNKLAKGAVVIAVLSMISQVLFSIHQDYRCTSGSLEGEIWHNSDCYRTFDFGIFGKITFNASGYNEPYYAQ